MKTDEIIERQLASTRFLKHSIGVTVKRFYSDVDGAIIDKASGLIPVNLKVKYPVFMLGAFDMDSGYRIGLQNLPPLGGAKYLMTFVNGKDATSYAVTGVSGLNTIQAQLFLGDIVHVFTDDVINPNFFVWIVQQNNATPLASIIQNTKTDQRDNRIGRIMVTSISYPATNLLQWNEALTMIMPDNIGDFRADSFQPNIWRTPQQGFTNTITVKLKFLIDQYMELATYIQFATDQIDFNFNLEPFNG